MDELYRHFREGTVFQVEIRETGRQPWFLHFQRHQPSGPKSLLHH